jgi:hypothetical protein
LILLIQNKNNVYVVSNCTFVYTTFIQVYEVLVCSIQKYNTYGVFSLTKKIQLYVVIEAKCRYRVWTVWMKYLKKKFVAYSLVCFLHAFPIISQFTNNFLACWKSKSELYCLLLLLEMPGLFSCAYFPDSFQLYFRK